MTSAFIVGCGVAGAAYALKGVIHVGGRVAQNEAAMKQAAALGAGIRGAGGVFKMPSFLSFTKHAGGFDAAINRREAALILNCRHVLPTPSSFCPRAHGPPTPPPRRESATKDELKKAHRTIMLLNHPDRGAPEPLALSPLHPANTSTVAPPCHAGGSPFLATKINEAHACQHGHPPLPPPAAPELGPCASSGRVPGGSGRLGSPRGRGRPTGRPIQPLPRVLERTASHVADFVAFDHPGVPLRPGPQLDVGLLVGTPAAPAVRTYM